MTKEHLTTEEIYTHEFMWRTGVALFKNAESAEPSDKFDFYISALLFYYLAYEGFINFSGQVLLPKIWAKEKEYFRGDNSGIDNKIEEIVKNVQDNGIPFEWKKGEDPYQTIKNLENFRHAIVHGKVIVNEYKTIPQNDGGHIQWKMPWDKFISPEEIKKSKKAIESFCESLRLVMHQCSDHPHLSHVAFQGVLASAKGGHP